jgi:hypothetical protein
MIFRWGTSKGTPEGIKNEVGEATKEIPRKSNV